MKKLIYPFVLALLFLQTNIWAQDETGYPGDNLSLEATLELFKNASSLEDFEQKLNSEKEGINNLDLNEDGKTDYIRLEDHADNDVHAIVLQTYINENEVQDIAVIEIEKTGAEEAMLQIVGDEDVYGEQSVVEPFETSESGHKGGAYANTGMGVIVNVWFWPSVRFIYRPAYRPWRSPWYWNTYPRWWRPWRPVAWTVYHPRVIVYHTHYRVAPRHRAVRAHRVYTPRRKSSVTVHQRTTVVRNTKHGKSVTTHTKNTKYNKGKATTQQKRTKTTAVHKSNKTGVKRTTTTTKAGRNHQKAGTKTTRTTTKAAKNGNKAGVKRSRTTTTKTKNRRG